ncbi:MAG: polyketide synthase dehydratase domain-containing protein, partial [Vicinamibacteria bacterium]
ETLPLGPGRVPVWSCWSVRPLPEPAAACRAAMTAQWTSLVRLRETVERLHDEGVRLFVEIGPDSKLTAFVDDTLRGRPYAAVATNHAARDDFEQIAHAVAQAFVAGFDVDTAATDRLIADAGDEAPILVSTTAPLTRDVREAAAGVHRRLIADAEARLARAAALLAPEDATPPVAVPGPLAGAPVAREAHHARGRRRFSREADRFVDDHALGRRRAAHPDGYPLPVLPFTASVAMAFEASRWWRAVPAVELRDVTATRWLALDGGRLDVDIDTRRRGTRLEIALRDAHATTPGTAFSAEAAWHAEPAPDVPADPGASAPTRWSARAFYERFAFHGPAFQGVTAVDLVGPRGIEATLTVTALPDLDTAALVVDPALLDCAGQLVAFWRLERGAAPDFGLFPFRARRILVARPSGAPGTTLRARASIVERDGVTESTVRLETPAGDLVAAIDGFAQRIVPLTPAVAALIIAGDASAVPGPGDDALLDSSWFIWERAIAHLRLSADDLAHWRTLDAVSGERRRWLLARLRDATQRGTVPE